MNTCEFYYISRRNNLPIQAKGIEKSWPELQQEFGRTGPGYPGATYYKTISSEGPQLFAVVNKKWVLYHEGDKWHRYITACSLKFETVQYNRLNSNRAINEQEDESWVIVSENDFDTELANDNM
ncbi:unnamed protein product [Rotaria sp. Silwood1]|nr:unnamed protein product [Rotaria sp. Silwood1]CAF3330523.1 unnamed protein product [Rotaria sp. Silwood1]CAF3349655.1 unnamed protein product [Rotaria sp. Silwood1]CAF3357735.1 unnamed protein product [Rotaria sp. Silwood1]CAF4500969.1 unnamed protein product [Rotaria sp. Silwood1]